MGLGRDRSSLVAPVGEGVSSADVQRIHDSIDDWVAHAELSVRHAASPHDRTEHLLNCIREVRRVHSFLPFAASSPAYEVTACAHMLPSPSVERTEVPFVLRDINLVTIKKW